MQLSAQMIAYPTLGTGSSSGSIDRLKPFSIFAEGNCELSIRQASISNHFFVHPMEGRIKVIDQPKSRPTRLVVNTLYGLCRQETRCLTFSGAVAGTHTGALLGISSLVLFVRHLKRNAIDFMVSCTQL